MVGAPIALKLYGLNLTVFQVPLRNPLSKPFTNSSTANLLCQHVGRKICLFLDEFFRKLGTLIELVAYDLLHLYQLSLLEIVENLGVRVCASALYYL